MSKIIYRVQKTACIVQTVPATQAMVDWLGRGLGRSPADDCCLCVSTCKAME